MTMDQVACFSEGKAYSAKLYPNILKNVVAEADLIDIRGEVFSFKITGVLIVEDTPVIVFPKSFSPSDDWNVARVEAALLIKVLLKYRIDKYRSIDEQELLFGSNQNHIGRIVSGLYLINDYQRYGLINRKEDYRSIDCLGSIDWASTIRTTAPMMSKRKPVYAVPIRRASINNPLNIISRIHAYVIEESIKHWGWIVGCEDFHEYSEELPCSVELALSLLKRELNGCYNQREISVIKNLISYLDAKNGRENAYRTEILATKYFYYVWEAICSNLVGNQYEVLYGVIPQPRFVSDVIKAKIQQRPDIIEIIGDTLYLFDAKYYDYTNTFPGWHDVVKQLFYRRTIEDSNVKGKRTSPLFGVKNYLNAFLLPEIAPCDFRYLGYVKVENTSKIGYIQVYSVNTKKAMREYVGDIKTSIGQKIISHLDTESN